MNRQAALTMVLLLLVLPGWTSTNAEPQTEDQTDPSRTPVVMAYPDSGINPYHMAFREPDWTAHPSTYVPGYPDDAVPLHLSLDAETYEEAVTRDAEIWDNIEPDILYYVPGTRIIGMMTYREQYPILDAGGHGTHVADAGSGKWTGAAPESAIVAVSSTGFHAYRWLADQKWIDIVSNSQSCAVPLTMGGLIVDVEATGWSFDMSTSPARLSLQMHEQGRLYFQAGGNGHMGTNAWCEDMPPWAVVVGGVGNYRENPSYARSLQSDPPFEIAGDIRGHFATHDSINSTTLGAGTSISAPTAAGQAATLVQLAREHLDHEGGHNDGKYATAAPGVDLPLSGPLADGTLTADELKQVLYHSSVPVRVVLTSGGSIPPIFLPDEVHYLHGGYGGIGKETFPRATPLLFGETAMEPRPWSDYWHHQIKTAQWEYWYPLVCKGDKQPTDWAVCTDNAGDWFDPAHSPPLPH